MLLLGCFWGGGGRGGGEGLGALWQWLTTPGTCIFAPGGNAMVLSTNVHVIEH